MNIHEYQAKEILTRFGVTKPKGGYAYIPEKAKDRANEPGRDLRVVKAKKTIMVVIIRAVGQEGMLALCKEGAARHKGTVATYSV